ncbi:MAG: hypothetical protein BRD23_06415 [Halobacteriales archaeon SW_9_67_25]|jgi:hypothetical protein|nr:MAG: hypothetical protein BRD23_06415 [Halobacteriales archaeon SW_9_67_25]
MGERAVLVQRQAGGGWTVYCSRWGGTDRALSAVCAGVTPSELPVTWARERSVDTFTRAVATLDYLGTELLYRETGRHGAFLALWFGLPVSGGERCDTAGAAVEIDSLQDARKLRGAFREFKGWLADALESGDLSAAAAPLALLGGVRQLRGRELYVVWRGSGASDILYREGQPPDL